MKLHQGVATAVVTTAAISAIIVGAYVFGIFLFPSLNTAGSGGTSPARGETAAQGQASANRTITSIVTVTRTIVTIGNAGCVGGGNGSDKFVKEEFPAPNSNQSASLGSVNVKNATRVWRTDRGFPLDGEQQRKVFAAGLKLFPLPHPQNRVRPRQTKERVRLLPPGHRETSVV